MSKKIRIHYISLLLLFVPFVSNAQQSTIPVNARYTGRIEYVLGNFGSFNYPHANDSVEVEIINDNLTVKFFPDRYLDCGGSSSGINILAKAMETKEEYKDIITPTEEKVTGSYNVKYTIGGKHKTPNLWLQIVHMGDGKMAYMTLLNEHTPFLGDILVARLNKIK